MQGLDLSPLGLFLAAGVVGKAVMAVLFVASLWCWVLIVEGVISVARLRRAVRAAWAVGEIAKPLARVPQPLSAFLPQTWRRRANGWVRCWGSPSRASIACFLAVGGVGRSVLLADREGVVVERRGEPCDDAIFED